MTDLELLIDQAARGEPLAQAKLFGEFEPRLRGMVTMRLDQRLQGKLDTSDVIQEAFIEYSESLPEYVPRPDLPFYIWLRTLTIRKLSNLQRQFLATEARDVNRELANGRGGSLTTSCLSLAEFFVGSMTSPSQAVLRLELQARIHEALNDMDSTDREILALRHFEQLSNSEAAQVLQISPTAASNRYIRALGRLRPLLDQIIAMDET
jgi:RNA polymerase sigma-70 factor, ECF subfamily